MILSLQTSNLFCRFGIDDCIKIIKESGADSIDFSMFCFSKDDPLVSADEEAYARDLLDKAKAVGLHFNQAHAPFPAMKYEDPTFNEWMFPRVKKSIKIAGLIGASAIVVHPVAVPGGGEVQKEFNMNMYRSLAPIAKEYGVKIAIENIWGHDAQRNIVPMGCSFAKELCDYFDTLNDSEAFTICLDVGHCTLVGEEPDEAIRILGKDRLGALHIHDNDYTQDNHTIPYDYGMKMDWEKITRALGEIDYQGDFTYEADTFLVRFDRPTIPLAAKFMVDLGHTLIAKIDAARPSSK